MDADQGIAQLNTALRPFRRKLLLHALGERALLSLWPFLLAATLIGVVARIWPIPADRWLIVAPLGAWLFWQVGAALLQPRSAEQDARTVDRRLGLHERVATALTTTSTSADALARLQLADAVNTLARYRPSDLQLSVRWRRAWPAVPLTACVTAALMLPNPLHDRLRAAAETAARREAAAAVLNAHLTAADQADNSGDSELTALRETLAALAERLRNEDTGLSQALAELNTTERQIGSALLPDREQRRLQLAELSRRLADLAQQPPDPPSVRRSAADRLEQTADRLADLDPAQQAAAAGRFSQLAAETAATQPELADSLASAAQDLQNGAVAAAAAALERAAARAREAEGQLARQAQRESALAALQQARQALQDRPGTGAAAAAAAESLPVPPGPAAQAAPTAPLSSSAREGAGNPAVDGRPAPFDGDAAVPAAALSALNGTAPGELRAPAVGAGPTGDTLPADMPIYTQRAREAIDRGQIPSHLRELVRDYFDALAQPESVAP